MPAADPFSELLRRTHLSAPSSACAIIIEQASCLGARAATLYIIDYEQNSLVPLGDAVLGETKYADWKGEARVYPVAGPAT